MTSRFPASIRPEKAPTVPYTFHVAAPAGARVELLGEVGDWSTGWAMRETSPGEFAHEVEVPEGAYAWKVKIDGAWTLPEGARTRARGGNRNAVASIGGAPEPVLFAAAPPWVVEVDRGGLEVRAALRRGAGAALAVAWTEGGLERVTPMEPWLDEDEHRLFRASVPASASRVDLALLLEDGRRIVREDGLPFAYERPRAADEPPAWWRRGVVYGVALDPFRSEAESLEGIRQGLAELADLGASVVCLTPMDVAAIDPALGDEAAFARLVNELHARSMRIVVDYSCMHAGDFAAPEARARVLDGAARWAARGVDGLRIDVSGAVPIDLAREVRRILRASRPDAIVIGDLLPAHAWRWRAEAAVDVATDYGLCAVVHDLFARASIDVPTAVARLASNEADRGGRHATAMRFLSESLRASTSARAQLATLLLMTWPGVPVLQGGEDLARDEAWRTRVRAIVRARRGSPALAEGDLTVLRQAGSLLVFRREGGGEIVDVALNLSEEPATLDLGDDARPAMEVLATVGHVAVRPPQVTLGPLAGAALGRGRGERLEAEQSARIFEAPRTRDRAMAAGMDESRAPPQRLFFALSETCNLRCEHCVSGAPQKTRSGHARSLTPRVLDRLRPALASASYFSFAHGGEPTAAPLFEEALMAIQHERAGVPSVVHLVTSGMLLGAKATERLIGLGVSSLCVSLDGATAAVNDAIRLGSRFEQITTNVREAINVRRRLGADLRVGLTLVVMQQNVGELGRAVELAAGLGVDWLRFEELVAATPFAKRSLVVYDDRARYAVARALARGVELGLPVVDRTRRRPVWRCRLDAEGARLLDAEELASRSEVHPCRAPWEDACVEANGDVRLGDFSGPLLGNLADATLEAMWNGDAARAARRRAPAARLCGEGPVVCLASGA